MRYEPKLPDESVNIPKENLFLQAVKLLIALIIIAVMVYGMLRVVLYFVVDHIPPSYEKKLVNLISFDMDVGEKHSSTYLDEMTEKLNQCAKLPYEIRTYVISEKGVNAFALPSGTIYVTQGMLDMVKNQNEIVAILGHEMGHFKNKDHLKSFGTSLLFSLLSVTLGEGYGSILETTLDISNIKYSQSAELASDDFALEVMQCAYGSVTDATKVFERLNKGEEWNYFLATHPAFSKRISLMKEKIAQKGYDDSTPAIPLQQPF
ncbi:MAG: M48 family metallopeptidase [Epsilonproteobacteria bacterium]|nr:M48 family metallopeptidase [Campylobacterota bacterium]